RIFVKTLTGQTVVIDIVLFNTTTVADLEKLIQEKEGIPSELQRLIYAGEHLEDGPTLQDYGIHNDSTIHVITKLRGG
ncbi:ubiquitin-related domain-containing protein, partial [Amylostereum chailletii]